MQNFIGWFSCAAIVYTTLHSVEDIAAGLSGEGSGSTQRSGKQTVSRLLALGHYSPILVSNYATIVYLIAHPAHPQGTRVFGVVYIAAITVAQLWS